MKTVVKWLMILCVISWAGHNPAEVGADIRGVVALGQSLVGSAANAAGSAVSGVSSTTPVTTTVAPH